MLFSGKENVFMCLAATKFVLRKINSGVWFIQTFLQKMLYMPNFPHTSSTVNMQIMNQFHTHSQKKQNPAKKFVKSGHIEIAQRRRRWDRAVKARSVRSSDKWRDRQSWSTSALVGRSLCSSIALLVNRRARSQSRSTRGAIDELARLDDHTARRSRCSSIDERCDCPTSALVDWRAARSPAKSLLPLSLSDLGSLFSLSLSLSLSFRKWIEVKMRV